MFGTDGGLCIIVDFCRITGGESLPCLSPMRGGVHNMVFLEYFLLGVAVRIAGDLTNFVIRKIYEIHAERKRNDAPPTKEKHR